jgi:hypothetical protein
VNSRSRLRFLTMLAGLFVALLAVAGMSGVAGATVMPLNASGCNQHSCIAVTGSASGYTATSSAPGTASPYILSISGPGCPLRSSPIETLPLKGLSCNGHGAGKVCASVEIRNSSTGAFEAAGEACETVS